MLQGALERAVRIVAIAALYQPLIHLVMERLSKCRLDIGVAAITELRLRRFEKALFAFRLVDTVAACAANLSLTMGRVCKIRMRASMAAQAFLIRRFGRRLGELEDFCNVAATVNVGLARTMAVLAGDAFIAMHERHAGVRVVGEFLYNILMAGFAGFGAGVAGGERRMTGRRDGSLLTAACIHPPRFPEAWKQYE
jgi:hypothetical protein